MCLVLRKKQNFLLSSHSFTSKRFFGFFYVHSWTETFDSRNDFFYLAYLLFVPLFRNHVGSSALFDDTTESLAWECHEPSQVFLLLLLAASQLLWVFWSLLNMWTVHQSIKQTINLVGFIYWFNLARDEGKRRSDNRHNIKHIFFTLFRPLAKDHSGILVQIVRQNCFGSISSTVTECQLLLERLNNGNPTTDYSFHLKNYSIN